MERAALLEEQLGLSRRPSVPVRVEPALTSDEPTLTGEEPTVTRDEPTLTRDEPTLTRDEPTLTREHATLNFDANSVDEATLRVTEPQRPLPITSEPPRANELETPDFRAHASSRAELLAAVGLAVALLVAGVATRPFAGRAKSTATLGAPRLPTGPIAEPRHEPLVPGPQPLQQLPTMPTNEASAASAAPERTPTDPALEQRPSASEVVVKVIPSRAVIFRAGKKLGSGEIRVSVERPAKQRLTALHNGYVPLNFTLDGSRDTVTIRLQRATPRSASREKSRVATP